MLYVEVNRHAPRLGNQFLCCTFSTNAPEIYSSREPCMYVPYRVLVRVEVRVARLEGRKEGRKDGRVAGWLVNDVVCNEWNEWGLSYALC